MIQSPTLPHTHGHSEPVGPGRKIRFWSTLLTGKVLIISIILHVLGGLGATYFVVQTIQAKRKVTFTGAPSQTSASSNALEHKVSMAKKQNAMSAPAQPLRVTAKSGIANITLPDLPELPKTDTFTPGKMAGMGGQGLTLGPAGGMGGGSGMGGGGNGPGIGFGGAFGFTKRTGGMLAGKFYDLKRLSAHKESGINAESYGGVIAAFIESGWSEAELEKYYKAPKSLYLSHVYIPLMSASLAPAAYGVERNVQPSCWVAHYKGTVAAPYTDSIRFYGYSDDMILVRFNGQFVLNGSRSDITSKIPAPPDAREDAGTNIGNGGLQRGPWISVTQGKSVELEILIGERPGGGFCAFLGLERKSKPATSLPGDLDLLRLANAKVKLEAEDGATLGPVNVDAPVWQGAQRVGGGLDYDRLGIQR